MQFSRNGSSFSLFPDGSLDIYAELPVGTYTVRFNQMTGQYYLEVTKGFELPKKTYGKTRAYGERILKTFEAKGGQIGVFLTGTKGSGKTLLAKWIAINSGYPVILVNTPFHDDNFMQAMQGISQKAIIIFDEFEKVYDKKQQERILTLFDGVYTANNKIIILTANDRWSVGDFFHNRPGRLRYALSYSGLDSKFIVEYCNDNLKNKKHLDRILKLAISCNEFNFDQLQTVVDELNMYCENDPSDEGFDTTVELLNIKTSIESDVQTWKANTIIDRLDKNHEFRSETKLRESPIYFFHRGHSFDVSISYNLKKEEWTGSGEFPEDGIIRTIYADISKEDLVSADPKNGTFTFLVKTSSEEETNKDDYLDISREFLITFQKEEKKSSLHGFSMTFDY